MRLAELTALGTVTMAAAANYGGMAIISVQEEKGAICVVTTGAEFRFDKDKGQVECFQRIPKQRQVGVISGLSLQDMKSEASPDGECRFSTGGGKDAIHITPDSLMRMRFTRTGMVVTVTGAYEPQHQSRAESHFFLPDEEGGIAAYLFGKGTCQAPASWKPPWTLQYILAGPGELWVSVFPPKPFDWQASCETMLHSFSWKHPYPGDEELKEWRNYGSVLTLHSWIWKGTTDQYIEKDNSWAQRAFKPKSEEELLRVTRTAHRLQMKVIAYMSPYYQADTNPAGIDEFVAKIREAMKNYGLDGVYFDGTFMDIRAAYDVVVKTRSAIGRDGILHIHSTGVPPISCPFMDCHANYMLRGEHCGVNSNSARWSVSSYNLDNSIGTFCHDAAWINKGMIAMILAANARLPIWVGDGTWDGAAYHLKQPELQLMLQEYLPRLEQIRKDHSTPRP